MRVQKMLMLMLLLMWGSVVEAQEDDPYTRAVDAIRQAQSNQDSRLDLGGYGLTQLPPEVGSLTYLQELYLSNNALTTLPPQIGNLRNLHYLMLNNNQLTHLPPQIGNLTQLKGLYLNQNQLPSLPPEIGQLWQLEELIVSGNRLTSLPFQIANLFQLRLLDVSNNQLTSLPDRISQLSNLHSLNIASNRLTQLPPNIDQLKNLEAIIMAGNAIEDTSALCFSQWRYKYCKGRTFAGFTLMVLGATAIFVMIVNQYVTVNVIHGKRRLDPFSSRLFTTRKVILHTVGLALIPIVMFSEILPTEYNAYSISLASFGLLAGATIVLYGIYIRTRNVIKTYIIGYLLALFVNILYWI